MTRMTMMLTTMTTMTAHDHDAHDHDAHDHDAHDHDAHDHDAHDHDAHDHDAHDHDAHDHDAHDHDAHDHDAHDHDAHDHDAHDHDAHDHDAHDHDAHDHDAHDHDAHDHEAHNSSSSVLPTEFETFDASVRNANLTAVLVGTKSPALALRLRYIVNTTDGDPLLAILPAETLYQLWQIIGPAERVLTGIALFVLLVGLASILIAILTSLNERRREMAILRANGASGGHILSLVMTEAALVGLIGSIAGFILVQAILAIIAPIVQSRYGLLLDVFQVSWKDLLIVAGVPVAAALMSIWPALKALKNALADGLTIRV